jgi:ubiquinone/menaquinone biosynthesis C-methylase UbiE
MPDVWAAITKLDEIAQDRLANVLEMRGADQQQRKMRHEFLSHVFFPAEAQVLEIGCGTGVLTRRLAQWPGVRSVVGVDPATSLVKKARELAAALPNVRFEEADGRALPFADSTFDVAIFDSTLSHVPQPERAIAEAFRVLRPGGSLGSFDGDYATTTVSLGDHDPLQACVDAMIANSVNDRWLMRRLAPVVCGQGFDDVALRGFGFVDTEGGPYMLSIIDRGADVQHAFGRLTAEAAADLKAEARRRAGAGMFFGHIAYIGVTARKPAA